MQGAVLSNSVTRKFGAELGSTGSLAIAGVKPATNLQKTGLNEFYRDNYTHGSNGIAQFGFTRGNTGVAYWQLLSGEEITPLDALRSCFSPEVRIFVPVDPVDLTKHGMTTVLTNIWMQMMSKVTGTKPEYPDSIKPLASLYTGVLKGLFLQAAFEWTTLPVASQTRLVDVLHKIIHAFKQMLDQPCTKDIRSVYDAILSAPSGDALDYAIAVILRNKEMTEKDALRLFEMVVTRGQSTRPATLHLEVAAVFAAASMMHNVSPGVFYTNFVSLMTEISKKTYGQADLTKCLLAVTSSVPILKCITPEVISALLIYTKTEPFPWSSVLPHLFEKAAFPVYTDGFHTTVKNKVEGGKKDEFTTDTIRLPPTIAIWTNGSCVLSSGNLESWSGAALDALDGDSSYIVTFTPLAVDATTGSSQGSKTATIRFTMGLNPVSMKVPGVSSGGMVSGTGVPVLGKPPMIAGEPIKLTWTSGAWCISWVNRQFESHMVLPHSFDGKLTIGIKWATVKITKLEDPKEAALRAAIASVGYPASNSSSSNSSSSSSFASAALPPMHVSAPPKPVDTPAKTTSPSLADKIADLESQLAHAKIAALEAELAKAKASAPSAEAVILGEQLITLVNEHMGTVPDTAIIQLIKNGADLRTKSRKGKTALHIACSKGNGPVIRALITALKEKGLDPQDKSFLSGKTCHAILTASEDPRHKALAATLVKENVISA